MEKNDPPQREKVKIVGIYADSVSAKRDVIVNTNIYPPASPLKSKTLHLFPQRNPKFTGRTSTIEQIQEALQSCHGKKNWWERVVVIYGFGGMGKSELAKVIAEKSCHVYDYINWFDVETKSSTKSSFTKFAKMLDLDCTHEVDCNKVYVTLQNQWKSGLLIFDNANILESTDALFGIQNLLPVECKSSHPTILVTSRHGKSYWGEDLYDIKMLDVDKLNEVDSYNCLVRYLGMKADDITEELKTAIVKLARQLDGYPLALSTVGRLIAVSANKPLLGMKAKIKDYTDVLASKSFEKLVGDSKMTAKLDKIMEWTIEKIKLEDDGPAALEILSIVAYMSSNEPSYVGLIRAIYLRDQFRLYNDFPEFLCFEDLDVKLKTCLSLLASYSLISIEEYEVVRGNVVEVVHMHRLIRSSCVASQHNQIAGTAAIDKMIQYFTPTENSTFRKYEHNLENLLSLISAKKPVNANQWMAVQSCLVYYNGLYSEIYKPFAAFHNFAQGQPLNPDQQRMINVCELDLLLKLSLERLPEDIRMDNKVLARRSAMFFIQDLRDTRMDQKSLQRDFKSRTIIFQPRSIGEAYEILNLAKSSCLINLTTGQTFDEVHLEMQSKLSKLRRTYKFHEYYRLSYEKNIYVVVNLSDILQDILSLSSKFVAQFWVLRKCISVLNRIKRTCGRLDRKPELLDFAKKSWTECETENRPHLEIIHLIDFLGGAEALNTDVLSSVYSLTSEYARRNFWAIVYKTFKDEDLLFDAVNAEMMSNSLNFSTTRRQIKFLYESENYLKVINKAAGSVVISHRLCRLNFCKELAKALSSMLQYGIANLSGWQENVFRTFRILFRLQTLSFCVCLLETHEILLNQLTSWKTLLPTQPAPSKVVSTEIRNAIDLFEKFRQHCATNNQRVWVDVASKYLGVFETHFRDNVEQIGSWNLDDQSEYLYDIVRLCDGVQHCWSLSKEFYTLGLEITTTAFKSKEILLSKNILKSLFFWFYLFNRNPNLSNQLEVDITPWFTLYGPILSDNKMNFWARYLVQNDDPKLPNVLTEFLGRMDKENWATKLARKVLEALASK